MMSTIENSDVWELIQFPYTFLLESSLILHESHSRFQIQKIATSLKQSGFPLQVSDILYSYFWGVH